jgi:hypothetical protein
MKELNMPAILPGTMKEQLRALAPYMVDHAIKANGGWVANLKIPIDAFITAEFNHEELAKYDLKLCVTIEANEMPDFETCGRKASRARYADVELSYK